MEIARYPLDRPGAYPVSAPWGQLVVEVKNGKARIALANPPCDPEVHKLYNPWISRPGELDVCLPHRALLEIREERR
ncbi:MAG: NusG domain II-containing protein [Chitinophagales bacterium]